MFAPGDTRRIMRQFGIQADKHLGQNFLIEQAALDKILKAADLKASDTVLEVGAGLGVLTCALAETAGHVVAVEFDRRLLPPLEWATQSFQNVRLIHADILSLELEDILPAGGYKVVANIPYNITSLLIRKTLEAAHPAELVVLTIQREVAQRIVALPGEMSVLALSVQLYGTSEICARIPAGCFYPRPKVDSAVIRIRMAESPAIPREDIQAFFLLVRAGFSQKRKQLKNSLSHALGWEDEKTQALLIRAKIKPSTRAQELSLEQWLGLVALYQQEYSSQT